MSAQWIRVPPRTGDQAAAGLTAAAVAVGVGLATFYLVRTLLAREPLDVSPPEGRPARGGGGEATGA